MLTARAAGCGIKPRPHAAVVWPARRLPPCRAYQKNNKQLRNCDSTERATAGGSPQPQLSDVERHRGFLLAQERLETLLEEAKLSNKDTVPVDHLDALNPEERLTLFTNLGTLALLGEVMSCLLFGEGDPLGGMDFNMASLHAAAYGVAFAVPLLLCSVAARSPLFRSSFPIMEQLHQQQADLQRHFTAGMNPAQMGIWLSFLVTPTLLTLLPATRAGVVWCASFAQQALLQTWASGLALPHLSSGGLAVLLAPLVGSYMAGSAASACFAVRPKQLEMLRDALRNADAYFRLAAARQPPGGAAEAGASTSSSGVRGSRGGMPPSVFASSSSLTLDQDASEGWAGEAEDEEEADIYTGGQAAADAFKTLAMVWLMSRRQVAQLAIVLSGMNVMYFSLLWLATGDCTTPLVAAMLHAGGEVWFGEQRHAARD